MLTRRRSLRSAIAVLGVGAAIALSSSPASAANEGTYSGAVGPCAATEKIQLANINGGWHDEMEFYPTSTASGCQFSIFNNNAFYWGSTGAGSGWIYDGPGMYLCPVIYYYSQSKPLQCN
ncbi:hypothetical protein OG500_37670 [Kitasatospora sp. NBC_01250]|uniref:hypothetical protein n=1 Tax=Kitasatospora sp. NBC_01250 TaxID=2903571 RepID=UPI002E3358E4|nr:hypothetical protein [Kitasatospora sp. NBC_01250]